MLIFNVPTLLDLMIIIVILLFIAICYLVIIIKNWINNKKLKENRKANREIAFCILDKFEEFLAENNIVIPSEEREGNEDEACLYGTKYYDLEDSIINILNTKTKRS